MTIRHRMMATVVVAVLAGLGASLATNMYLSSSSGDHAVDEEVVVLEARKRVPGYTHLSEPGQWFEVKKVPKTEAPRDAIRHPDHVRGRTVKIAIEPGGLLTESHLLPPGQEPLVAKLREGERLMTVKVTLDSAAGGFILPGSRVDVVATQMRGENNQPFAKTILQNIEVLAIDQQPQIPEGTIAKTYDRVTLRVTLEQAEILSVYADTGTLRLVARRPDDTSEVKTPGASPSWHRHSANLDTLRPQNPVVVAQVPVPALSSKKQPFRQTIINNGQVRIYEYESDDAQ
ncbi:MAG: Flp pilus assembly protein CpaB [Gemmatales bacterium]|nr:Flp pilus assembly protein CpaB [Gemmatales bacterium]MDW8176384.1 Flp pilus assembly protein CpaB [Gemmatales bacterium]